MDDKKENLRTFDLIQKYYLDFEKNLQKKYQRSLPFQESILDRFERAKLLKFGEKSSIYNSSFVFGEVRVGKNTWIGPNTVLDGSGEYLEIGDYCSISSGVQIYTHDTVMWAISGGYHNYIKNRVKIGNCNYIGSMSIINLGVEIGNNCVIAANSFVNCNVSDRSIFGGTPAKKIGEVVGEKEDLTLKYKIKKN